MATQVVVSIVDDDISVRQSLPDLLIASGYVVRAFESAEEFLAKGGANGTHCLVLDVLMPGMSGPDLQRELERRGCLIPIIFITAHRDDLGRKRLIGGQAVDCLAKPFSAAALLEAVGKATAGRA